MDATERKVRNYLDHQGYVDIVFEPDGNIPPDFLVNREIAIEVRRLNQNFDDGINTKGLEEVAIPLNHKINNLISSFGGPIDNESWFVYYRFSRPIGKWRTLEPIIKSGFQSFISSTNRQKCVIAKTSNFQVEVFRTAKPHNTFFVMGGFSDEQSGGWLLNEMENNIVYCSSKKSRTVAPMRDKYKTWWLALVDHIGYGLDDFDREMFRDKLSIEHDWDKILIIDPNNNTRSIEI